jgi:hypothetical protein
MSVSSQTFPIDTPRVALALLDRVSDGRSERTALWIATLSDYNLRYYARHNGIALRVSNGK